MAAACWNCLELADLAERDEAAYEEALAAGMSSVGHFACGPISDADLARWRAGERPMYVGRTWVWPGETELVGG